MANALDNNHRSTVSCQAAIGETWGGDNHKLYLKI